MFLILVGLNRVFCKNKKLIILFKIKQSKAAFELFDSIKSSSSTNASFMNVENIGRRPVQNSSSKFINFCQYLKKSSNDVIQKFIFY